MSAKRPLTTRKEQLAGMNLRQLAKVLKAIADEKRLQIIQLLGTRSLCVCEFEPLLELAQPAVSHHLRILREAGLVTDKRHGKWIFYSLNQDAYLDVLAALQALFKQNMAGDVFLPSLLCKKHKKQEG